MNIIIIDDDHLVVSSLETIMESVGIRVLAKGYSGEEGLSLYRTYKPDLVLMDIRMESKSGIQASQEILSYDRNAKILLVTTFKDRDYIEEALRLGAKGYILKDNISGIIPAVRAVYAGNMVFDSEIISEISPKERRDLHELSAREKDVLFLIAKGLNNKEISEELFLSQGTVRNYISTMLGKLNLRDRTQLAIYYYRGKDPS